MTQRLSALPGQLCIARLNHDASLPSWLVWDGPLICVCRTEDELSIVCSENIVPQDVVAERGWRAFKVEGPLKLAEVGVLSELSAPLAGARISLFAISTYDTDYVLVREADFEKTCKVLARDFDLVAG